MASDKNPIQEFALKSPRTAGLIYTTIGSLISYFCLIGPVLDAQNGAENITYFTKAFLLGVCVILLGLGLVVFGSRFALFLFDNKEALPTWKLYLFIALIVLPFIALDIWLTRYLSALGYATS